MSKPLMIKFEVCDINKNMGGDYIVSCRSNCGSKMDVVFLNKPSFDVGHKVTVNFDWGEENGTDETSTNKC